MYLYALYENNVRSARDKINTNKRNYKIVCCIFVNGTHKNKKRNSFLPEIMTKVSFIKLTLFIQVTHSALDTESNLVEVGFDKGVIIKTT